MWLKRLSILAIFLAITVVALGAYTRLKDAGLGCPDWPGCYGKLVVPESSHAIAEANAAYPHRPLEMEKAWAEMVHRYFASGLGLIIVIIFILSWRGRKTNPAIPLKLPALITVLVIFQGLLGMWTVTLGLFPTVVMAHLLGGFTTLCLLFLLALRLFRLGQTERPATPTPLFKWSILATIVLTLQIALGGWTAANYSAAVCTEFPLCQSGWQQHINIPQAFKFWGHGFNDYEFATHLETDAKITIHVAHRIGALFTTIALMLLFFAVIKYPQASNSSRNAALLMGFLLLLQLGLGIANVLFQIPLQIAVAHNLMAALLMMSLINLNARLYWSGVTNHVTNHRQPEPIFSVR